MNNFKIKTQLGAARVGELITPHGTIKTPVFMNVATQAAIKGALSAQDLKEVGCQVALSNTYHLHLRPSDELIATLGGLHKFMAWDGPILTDSGGFQIFSLAKLRKITEEGVAFSSHIDGKKIFMSPEDSIRIQANLGSDIAMAFDECIAIPSEREYVEKSCELTYRWLNRCVEEHERLKRAHEKVSGTQKKFTNEQGMINPQQMLFGINQGAIYKDLRISHMKQIAKLDLPGYAIGGLAVGETAEEMYETIEAVEPYMPKDKPRYLMGVGTPQNIVEAVYRGVDFFDCVMPARNGRHGRLYTTDGSLNILNERFRADNRPVDETCPCPLCANFSRAYLRHLFKAGEMLAMRLSVLHNLYFYNRLMAKIRESIQNGTFNDFRNKCLNIT